MTKGNEKKPERKRLILIRAAIIVALTILTIISPVRKGMLGVFGYLYYVYYGVLIILFAVDLALKGKFKKIPLKQIILIGLTLLFAFITLHINLLGKTVVNSGFSDYIANVYNEISVGGVTLSLISAPIVLPCKYVASLIIFFIAFMVCAFLTLYPYIFVNKHKKTKVSVKKEADKLKPDEAEKRAGIGSEKTEAMEQPGNNVAIAADSREKTLEDEVEDRKRETLKKLFGDNYISRESTAPVRKDVIVDDMPKIDKKEDFSLIGGYEAFKIKPSDNYYSDNERISNLRKRREEATQRLGLRDAEMQKKIASSDLLKEDETQTKEEELKSTFKINEYVPASTIYDDEKPSQKEQESVEEAKKNNDFYSVEKAGFGNSYLEEDENKVEGRAAATEEHASTIAAAVLDTDLIDTDEKTEEVYRETKTAKKTPKAVIAPIEAKKIEDDTERIIIKRESKEGKTSKFGEGITVKTKRDYRFPDRSMLEDHASPNFVPYVENTEELRELVNVKFKNYNIDAEFIDAVKGPTITTCYANLSDTCSISKVMSAKQDINRLLRTTKEINILPQIEGSPYFAIEIPNKVRGMVSFKEIISSKEYISYKGELIIAMGKTADGKILIDDLAAMPHALVAGSTGSGKSVCLNCILASLLFRYPPDELQLVLIDLKKVEMGMFGGLPHMLVEKPLYEINEIINTLKWLESETERRYTAFENLHVKKLSEYNEKVGKSDSLPRIVVIIDEASELMTNPMARKPVEASLSSLARVARAAGIHLIFATQNPVKEVITNEIQNNLNTKIAFAVGDYNHSMVIFKTKGAEKLLGNGDMFIRKGGKSMVRAQCAYISSEEIDGLVNQIRERNDVDFDYDAIERILHGSKEDLKTNSYGDGGTVNYDGESGTDDKWEETLLEALALCYKHNKASGSLVQRKLNKGSNTTTNIMETLEERGWVSPVHNNKRTLLRSKEEFYAAYPDYERDDFED